MKHSVGVVVLGILVACSPTSKASPADIARAAVLQAEPTLTREISSYDIGETSVVVGSTGGANDETTTTRIGRFWNATTTSSTAVRPALDELTDSLVANGWLVASVACDSDNVSLEKFFVSDDFGFFLGHAFVGTISEPERVSVILEADTSGPFSQTARRPPPPSPPIDRFAKCLD